MTWLRKLAAAIRGGSTDSGYCQFNFGDISNFSTTRDSETCLESPPSYSSHDPKMPKPKPTPTRQPFLFPLLDQKHDEIKITFTTRVPKKVLRRITMHLTSVDQTCLARTNKSFFNAIQLLRWDSSGIPRTQAESSLLRCLCQRDDPTKPSCVECHAVFARVVDGLGTTHATTTNGWSFLLTGDHSRSTFRRQTFEHLLPQCLASPDGSIQLTRGYRNWIQSDRVEVDVRLVHVDRKAVALTRWTIPEKNVYHAAAQEYGGQIALAQLFTGVDIHLCVHIKITDHNIVELCACTLEHNYGIPCTGCNYPLCCNHCKTEVEKSREILPDGRKSLVVTTWRNLGRLNESPVEDAIWKVQWKANMSWSDTITRSALLRSQVRAVGGPPVVMEERGLKFLVSPGRKVSMDDPSRWSNIP